MPGRFWGAHTGPSPVDRGKAGCKRHVIADAKGLPLLVATTPADVRDEVPLVDLVKALPAVKQRGGRGRPPRKPKELLGDRGYGFAWTILAVVAMGIRSLPCPRGSAHGSGLGRRRYVIERTMAWFANFRRLRLCYEKKPVHWQAFNELAACIICGGRLGRRKRRHRVSG